MKKQFKILSALLMPLTIVGTSAVVLPLVSCSKNNSITSPAWGYYAAGEKDNNWTGGKVNDKITVSELKKNGGDLFANNPNIRITYGDLNHETSSDNLYLTVFDSKSGVNILNTTALTTNLDSLDVRISEASKTYINAKQYDESDNVDGYIKFKTVVDGTEDEFDFIKTLKSEAKIAINQLANENTVKTLLNPSTATIAMAANGKFDLDFKVNYHFKQPITLDSGEQVSELPFSFTFDVQPFRESELKWGYRPYNGSGEVTDITDFATEGGNFFHSGTTFNIDYNSNKWASPSEILSGGKICLTAFNPENNSLIGDHVSANPTGGMLQSFKIYLESGFEYVQRTAFNEKYELNNFGPLQSLQENMNWILLSSNAWWSATDPLSVLEKEAVQQAISANGYAQMKFRLELTFKNAQASVTTDSFSFYVNLGNFIE